MQLFLKLARRIHFHSCSRPANLFHPNVLQMKKLIFTIALTILIIGLQAQETMTTSGGEASGEAGIVSYTVGQVAYDTHTGIAGSVAEGIQQPYEISVVIGIEESEINLNIAAYPNPVNDHLILKMSDDSFIENRLTASLYDMKGSLIKQQIVVNNETTIDMADQTAGIYFLKIQSETQKEIKTFKIIKN